MNYLAFSGLVNGLTSAILMGYVLIGRRQTPLNRSFVYFAFSVFFWSFGYFFWGTSNDQASALFWSRLLMAGAILIPIAFFNFALNLTGRCREKRRERIIALMIGFVLLLLDFTPKLVAGISKRSYFTFWPDPGYLYPFFLLTFFFYAVYSLYLMYAAYRTASIHLKQQIKYVFAGTAVGFLCGATNFLLWYHIPIPPYPNVFVSAYVVTVAYAIIRHRLMDIKVVIKRTAVYSILTALLTGIFLAFILLGEFIFRGFVGYSSVWLAILAAFVVALAFQPLRGRIQEAVDRLFFKGKYDYRDTLKNLSHASTSIINLDQLISSTSTNVSGALKPEKVSFYLWDKEKGFFQLQTPKNNACLPSHFYGIISEKS